MKHHVLKSWPVFFVPLISCSRSFDLRKDDRGFEVGDELILLEWDRDDDLEPTVGQYTGREARAEVCHILRSGEVPGLQDGYCILEMKNVRVWAADARAVSR